MGYWEDRIRLRDLVYRGLENQTMGVISSAYERAGREIEEQLERIIGNYAKWQKLDPGQAMQQLNALAPAARPYAARITRLEAIREAIREGMEKAAGVQLSATKSCLKRVGRQAFFRTLFDLQKRVGGFAAGSPEASLDQILRNSWSGQHWSTRVWQNQRAAARIIEQTVVETLSMGGRPTDETFRQLFDEAMQKPGVTARQATHAANRIVRTESAYVANQESLEAYRRAGIEEYEFVAVLDSRTSEQCQERDGKTYRVDSVETGVNYPPLHPFCRSSTGPVLRSGEQTATARWARSLITGKGEIIPGDMNYKEWKTWQDAGAPPIRAWRNKG